MVVQAQNDPIRLSPQLYLQGLSVAWVSNTTLTIADGQCRDSSNNIDMGIGSNFLPLNGQSTVSPLTINAAINGVNGLDTGTLANNSWYALYIIGDSSFKNPVGGILTLASNTAPALPKGYDSFRLRYYVLTDGSAHLINFYSIGTGSLICNVWDSTISVLASGAATTFTAVDLSSAIPPKPFGGVKVLATYTPAVAGNTFSIRPTGSTATAVNGGSGVVAAKAQILQLDSVFLLASAKPEIDYKVTASDTLSLSVLNFTVNV